MGSINTRKGKLFFDFRYQGKRCREYTKLSDTPSNRKRMQAVLNKIEAEITLGSFIYANYFPGSSLARTFASIPTLNDDRNVNLSNAPLYAEFAEIWFMESEVSWRRSHTTTVRSTLDTHLIPAFGDQSLGNITKADCLHFRACLAKLPGRGKNTSLAPKTINRIMQIHHQIMSEASERYEFPNPTDRIKQLRVPKQTIHPFSLEEANRLINNVRTDYRNYLITRLFTGMRTGEINGLQWKYIDFERKQILIREALVRNALEYTKTDGSQREIQMSQLVYNALKQQEKATRKRSNFVFCNQSGEHLNLENFTNRVWYPLLRYLDLEKRRPYQTRHTAATLWLAAGENPEWVARQLGHTNTEMLFKTYSRFIPNLTRTDGSAMNQLLTTHIAVSHQPLPPM